MARSLGGNEKSREGGLRPPFHSTALVPATVIPYHRLESKGRASLALSLWTALPKRVTLYA